LSKNGSQLPRRAPKKKNARGQHRSTRGRKKKSDKKRAQTVTQGTKDEEPGREDWARRGAPPGQLPPLRKPSVKKSHKRGAGKHSRNSYKLEVIKKPQNTWTNASVKKGNPIRYVTKNVNKKGEKKEIKKKGGTEGDVKRQSGVKT